MAAFRLAIVPRCFGTDLFVNDMILSPEEIEHMNTLRVFIVAKLRAILCLDDLRGYIQSTELHVSQSLLSSNHFAPYRRR